MKTVKPLWLVEKVYIEYALQVHNNNRTYAARALEISLRTIRNKIRQYRESQGRPKSHKLWSVE